MARIDSLTNFLTDIATAIKTKKGDDTPILASNFDTEITNLPSGATAPEVGFVVDEYDTSGYATKVTVYGSSIPSSAFYTQSDTYANYLTKNLTDVIFNDTVTSIGNSAFKGTKNLVNIGSIDEVTYIGTYAFQNCNNLVVKKVNKVSNFPQASFQACESIVQLSMESATTISGNGSTSGAFYGCKGLKAVWLGSNATPYQYTFNGCTNMIKIFIDIPRATVESRYDYQYAFMNNTSKTGIIVCNDDEGFITREEFDAIDWATYTE